MGSARLILSFVLGLGVLAGILVFVYFQRGEPGGPEEARPDASAVQSQAEATETLEENLEDARKETSELRIELDETKAALARLEAQKATEAQTPSTTEPETYEGEEPPAEEGAGEKEKPTLEQIAESIAKSPMAKTQFTALTEMIYGSVLEEMALSEEDEKLVRDLLIESFAEQAALSQYAMVQENVTAKEWKQWENEENARLSEELRAALSPESFEAWEAFEADAVQRRLTGQFEPQVRTYSSGLTPENHDLVLEVAVQEFMAVQDEFEQSDQLYTLRSNIDMQLTALSHMRTRFQELLDGDQYREANRWLELGETQLNGVRPPDPEGESAGT